MGWTTIEKVADDPLLHGISSPFVAFNWHAYSCKISPTSHLVATCGEGVQVFRAGGRAWGTQFHPEVDAEMAPHWVRDAVKEQKHLGEAFAEKLAHGDRRAAAGVPGVLPPHHRELRRQRRAAARLTCGSGAWRPGNPAPYAQRRRSRVASCTRFRAAPRGGGPVKGAMGWYLEVPCVEEGCVEGDSTAQTVYYHHPNS